MYFECSVSPQKDMWFTYLTVCLSLYPLNRVFDRAKVFTKLDRCTLFKSRVCLMHEVEVQVPLFVTDVQLIGPHLLKRPPFPISCCAAMGAPLPTRPPGSCPGGRGEGAVTNARQGALSKLAVVEVFALHWVSCDTPVGMRGLLGCCLGRKIGAPPHSLTGLKSGHPL